MCNQYVSGESLPYVVVMGIDLGNHTGISITKYDINSKSVLDIYTTLIKLDIGYDAYVDNMVSRTYKLESVLTKLLHDFDPSVVVIENVFVNKKFPYAAISLSQYLITCKRAIYNFNSYISIIEYPPKYIKKHIGAGGSSDKDGMLNILKKKKIYNYVKLDQLSEHEIDAICVALVYLDTVT